MVTKAENVLAVGAENRPPMLKKGGYERNGKAIGKKVINIVGDLKVNPSRVIMCYNCKGEGRAKDFLVDGLEELDSDCDDLQQQKTSIFKVDHVDAFDSDCNEAPTTSAVFMARLSPTSSVNGDVVGLTYDSYILSEIVEIVLWFLDFGCSKHMTRQHEKLINFVSKFIDTVRFGNDHFAAIMGYGDLQTGNNLILRVYYVEGLDGVYLPSRSRGFNLYTISLEDMIKSSPICLLSKASKIKSWSKKESYKPKHEPSTNEKLHMLHMGFCKPMRVESINGKRYILVIADDYSREDLRKLKPKADIGIFIRYSPSRKAYRIYYKRTRMIMEMIPTINSRLVPNQVSLTSAIPPSKDDLDLLFQPMFDEYFQPSPSDVSLTTSTTTLPQDTAKAYSSITIDQDAPYPTTSINIETTTPPI
uniref:Integrase, catalytic region, zinc finger, CCHC-type, peptidase aspartic, catalytic n=1 Tax=Tanacetum cinerariifolium TaxID=118510 RepID=A0A6L2MB94_TANCI|nr:integrase, catalytic region, zinc finger, CCHC-type, peptidase aspartic, catalytic [Tanacetum cinerariifolium]